MCFSIHFYSKLAQNGARMYPGNTSYFIISLMNSLQLYMKRPIANRPTLGALANTSLRGIYISCVTQSLMCSIEEIIFKFFFDRKHGFTWGFISTTTIALILCPSWTPLASLSWTLSCLDKTLLRNFLVASGSKRTVADLFSGRKVAELFSGRKGGGLRSSSHFRPRRKSCLEKQL